ncbi:MAG: FAD:protein transferase [Pseudonocardiales bacterium]|jgi:thiamine biosynthesis lipoprotein|nr:FAD:protein transferase [Pseudonocardiales bacterium]
MTATHTIRAWSCLMRLVVEDDRALAAAAADLDALLARVEAAASRFRSDSALSIANLRAGRPTPIPRILVQLISAALDAARDTEGLVDPTVGRCVRTLGYDRDLAVIEPDGPAVSPAVPHARWQAVRLDSHAGLLTVPRGVELDLGATAKAWTADVAARTLSSRYGTAVLVELGGDLAVAGTRRDGWRIDVAEHAGGPGEQVVVHHGGLATSTTTIRRWRRGDADVHHLIDPRTGAPADTCWRTASVYATTAVSANVASTAAIVLGDDAMEWLERRNLAARLVDESDAVATTRAWPRPRVLAVA